MKTGKNPTAGFIPLNFYRLIPVFLSFILIFALVFTACNEPEEEKDDEPAAAFIGNTMELSGTVYTADYDEENGTISYTPYEGDNMRVANVNGWYYGDSSYDETLAGDIIDGQLAITIGTPENFDYESFLSRFLGGGFTDLKISNTNVRSSTLSLRIVSDNPPQYGANLYRGNATASEENGSYSGTEEGVQYVYVDRDVTISGKGTTLTDSGVDEGVVWTETVIYKDVNISLKKGWNVAYYKGETIGTQTETTQTQTLTLTISMSNPSSLKWILQEE
jgi:hypothetical protein